MSTGYSGTPLAKKLGIKEGLRLAFFNLPAHYFDLFSDLPDGLEVVDELIEQEVDFIHLFCTSFDELESNFLKYKLALKKNGSLWISWPKGSSSIQTNLKRDLIREYILKNGLVDVKVAAVDQDWSGLKFVYRLTDR